MKPSILVSTFAAALLLVTRRARRDLLPLVTFAALVCFVAVLAMAAPRIMLDALDGGAREAVADAGPAADVVVTTFVGSSSTGGPAISPQELQSYADNLPSRLPRAMASAAADTVTTVLSPEARSTLRGSETADAPADVLSVQLGMLTDANTAELTVVEGALPEGTAETGGSSGDSSGPAVPKIDVAISAESAEAASLTVGSVIEVDPPPPLAGIDSGGKDDQPQVATRLVVVGIIDSPDRASEQWIDIPKLWKPAPSSNNVPNAVAGIAMLTTPDGITRSLNLFSQAMSATVRVQLDASVFTADLEERVEAEARALSLNTGGLTSGVGAEANVRSGFVNALADYLPKARAAVAQMSVVVAGVIGVAATVIVLLSRLVLLRRMPDLALERARGASVAAIAIRAGIESLVLSVIAVAAGLGIVAVVVPSALAAAVDPTGATLLGVVIAVAVVASPVQSALVARGLGRAERRAANSSDRRAAGAVVRSRRIALELTLVALAAAALVALRNRGLLQTRTEGIDPLLSAAPLLLAAVVTVVLLRLYPFVVRAAARLGRRTRGPLGILGAVHAERSLAALPLLALTLAVGLAVGGGLLVDTVRSGQMDASWQRVGADARVEGAFAAGTGTDAGTDAAEVARRTAGVTAAASVLVVDNAEARAGTSDAAVTFLAVDAGYADVVAALPDVSSGADAVPGTNAADADLLRNLTAASAGITETDRLPVLIDERLARQLPTDEIVVQFGDESIASVVTGTIAGGPTGYLGGPFVIADLDAVAVLGNAGTTGSGTTGSGTTGSGTATDPQAFPPTSLLLVGPGAEDAAAVVAGDGASILDRTDWLAEQRSLALVSGVESTMLLSVAAVGILAALALIAGVLASARERGRSLGLLRTLGMRARLGWWLAIAEVAPLVAAAVIGGIAAGVAIVLALAPAFGLGLLAGGDGEPAPSLSPWVILGVAAGAIALLLVAVLAEVLAQRRNRLNDILRVGETV